MIRNPFLPIDSSASESRPGLGLGIVALFLTLALLLAATPIGLQLGALAEGRSGLRLSAGLLGFIAAAVLSAPRLGPVVSFRPWAGHLAGCAILSAAATFMLAGFLDGLLGAAR